MKEPISVDVDGTIDIPHLGITLRVLLAVAVENSLPLKRQYPVRYKGAIVAKVRIKNGNASCLTV